MHVVYEEASFEWLFHRIWPLVKADEKIYQKYPFLLMLISFRFERISGTTSDLLRYSFLIIKKLIFTGYDATAFVLYSCRKWS